MKLSKKIHCLRFLSEELTFLLNKTMYVSVFHVPRYFFEIIGLNKKMPKNAIA